MHTMLKNFKKGIDKLFLRWYTICKSKKAVTKTVEFQFIFRELMFGANQRWRSSMTYHFRAGVLKCSVGAPVIAA